MSSGSSGFWKPGTMAPHIDKPREVPAHLNVNVDNNSTNLPKDDDRKNFELSLMKSLDDNDVVIINYNPYNTLLTGVPLILYDDGFCSKRQCVIIVHPSSSDAISAAVTDSLSLKSSIGDLACYQTEFDSKLGDSPALLHLTYREFSKLCIKDPSLENISCVIFTKVHSRSIMQDTCIFLTHNICSVKVVLQCCTSISSRDMYSYFSQLRTTTMITDKSTSEVETNSHSGVRRRDVLITHVSKRDSLNITECQVDDVEGVFIQRSNGPSGMDSEGFNLYTHALDVCNTIDNVITGTFNIDLDATKSLSERDITSMGLQWDEDDDDDNDDNNNNNTVDLISLDDHDIKPSLLSHTISPIPPSMKGLMDLPTSYQRQQLKQSQYKVNNTAHFLFSSHIGRKNGNLCVLVYTPTLDSARAIFTRMCGQVYKQTQETQHSVNSNNAAIHVLHGDMSAFEVQTLIESIENHNSSMKPMVILTTFTDMLDINQYFSHTYNNTKSNKTDQNDSHIHSHNNHIRTSVSSLLSLIDVVIDSGVVQTMHTQPLTNVTTVSTHTCTRANAMLRSRVVENRGGMCVRLYSENVYLTMKRNNYEVEIQMVDDAVLIAHAFGYTYTPLNLFPRSIPAQSATISVNSLLLSGCLVKKPTDIIEITSKGVVSSLISLPYTLAVTVLNGLQEGCVSSALFYVCAKMNSLFIQDNNDDYCTNHATIPTHSYYQRGIFIEPLLNPPVTDDIIAATGYSIGKLLSYNLDSSNLSTKSNIDDKLSNYIESSHSKFQVLEGDHLTGVNILRSFRETVSEKVRLFSVLNGLREGQRVYEDGSHIKDKASSDAVVSLDSDDDDIIVNPKYKSNDDKKSRESGVDQWVPLSLRGHIYELYVTQHSSVHAHVRQWTQKYCLDFNACMRALLMMNVLTLQLTSMITSSILKMSNNDRNDMNNNISKHRIFPRFDQVHPQYERMAASVLLQGATAETCFPLHLDVCKRNHVSQTLLKCIFKANQFDVCVRGNVVDLGKLRNDTSLQYNVPGYNPVSKLSATGVNSSDTRGGVNNRMSMTDNIVYDVDDETGDMPFNSITTEVDASFLNRKHTFDKNDENSLMYGFQPVLTSLFQKTHNDISKQNILVKCNSRRIRSKVWRNRIATADASLPLTVIKSISVFDDYSADSKNTQSHTDIHNNSNTVMQDEDQADNIVATIRKKQKQSRVRGTLFGGEDKPISVNSSLTSTSSSSDNKKSSYANSSLWSRFLCPPSLVCVPRQSVLHNHTVKSQTKPPHALMFSTVIQFTAYRRHNYRQGLFVPLSEGHDIELFATRKAEGICVMDSATAITQTELKWMDTEYPLVHSLLTESLLNDDSDMNLDINMVNTHARRVYRDDDDNNDTARSRSSKQVEHQHDSHLIHRELF